MSWYPNGSEEETYVRTTAYGVPKRNKRECMHSFWCETPFWFHTTDVWDDIEAQGCKLCECKSEGEGMKSYDHVYYIFLAKISKWWDVSSQFWSQWNHLLCHFLRLIPGLGVLLLFYCPVDRIQRMDAQTEALRLKECLTEYLSSRVQMLLRTDNVLPSCGGARFSSVHPTELVIAAYLNPCFCLAADLCYRFDH